MSKDAVCSAPVLQMFKMDYTIDSSGRCNILELGHAFSSNHSGLEENFALLVGRLKAYYDFVFVSGDFTTGAAVAEGLANVAGFDGFWPLDELDMIPHPERSVVVIRALESPTHFTPFEVRERLRARGIPLAVFNAEPLGCLCAYEKIIMQRLQEARYCNMSVPTAVVDCSSDDDVQEQLRRQGIVLNSDEFFVVKPAFSNCAAGVEVLKKSKLLKYLNKKRVHTTEPFHRGADDTLNMLSISDAATGKSPAAVAKLYSDFAQEHGMGFMFDNKAKSSNKVAQDPFVLVQPLMLSHELVIGENRRYYPTYRAFVTVEPVKNTKDVQVVPLIAMAILPAQHHAFNGEPLAKAHVVAGLSSMTGTGPVYPAHLAVLREALNDGPTRSFFRAVMYDDALPTLKLLELGSDENFQRYTETLRSYPPYQMLLKLPQDRSEMRRYRNLGCFLHIFAYQSRVIPISDVGFMRQAMDALTVYESVREQDQTASMAYVPFFVDLLLSSLRSYYYQPVSSSPSEQKRDTLQFLLGMLGLITDALKRAEVRSEADAQLAEAVVGHYVHVFNDLFSVRTDSDTPPMSLFLPRHRKQCLKYLIAFSVRLKNLERVLQAKRLNASRIIASGSVLVQWLVCFLRCLHCDLATLEDTN